MKTLIQRMLVSTAIAIISLAPAGNAMAANPHLSARAAAVRVPYRHQTKLDVAAIPPYPINSPGASPAPEDFPAQPPYSQWARYPVAGPGISRWAGYPVAGSGMDVGQLIAALVGGALPLHYGGKATASSSGSYDFDYSPAPDTSASDAVGWAAEQSANDASAAAIQENDANLQALDASIAASEQQNDQANADTQQYLINNGM